MTNSTRNSQFAKALARDHQSLLDDDERARVEQMLGPGAVRFKLDKSGARRLFRTIGAGVSGHGDHRTARAGDDTGQ